MNRPPLWLLAGVFLFWSCPLLTSTRGAEKPAAPGAKPLVIHEWGTFTCLQNERGEALFGINTDDEPVPDFVHRIADLIPRPSELAPVFYKGVPRAHREVRMRLETPVIYFHPPADRSDPLRLTLQVDFAGGWLTEYYPNAAVSTPGLDAGNFRFSGLTPHTRGRLTWSELTVGGSGKLPQTEAAVWLSPREVTAATVTTRQGESEKYLFYRGVGNLASPITVVRNAADNGLVIREEVATGLEIKSPLPLRAVWLVHVRRDGQVAYRTLGSARLTGQRGRTLFETPLMRGPSAEEGTAANRTELRIGQYAADNLGRLRGEMRTELVADGLYVDEAEAMLKTWELAYFKSPGLRVFYLLPQQWTDAVLPLTCSVPAEVSRTMVGRVEIVTPEQRTLLKQISQAPVTPSTWLYRETDGRGWRQDELGRLWEGTARFEDLKIPVPPEYRAYLDLGRFRNALVLDESVRVPAGGIGRFVDAYALDYFESAPESETAAAGGGR